MVECYECGVFFTPANDAYECPNSGAMDNYPDEDGPDGSCPRCGGSGGGIDPALRCTTCGGTGDDPFAKGMHHEIA